MQNPVLQEVAALYSSKKDSIQSSRTAKLWQQYMDMITILRNFITAERLGDWILYLETLKQMLPYLAASGHNLYTKSVVVFLNDMQDLPLKHPEVYQHFWMECMLFGEALGNGLEYLQILLYNKDSCAI